MPITSRKARCRQPGGVTRSSGDGMQYKPAELVLSILYYGHGQYTVEEIMELVELIASYEGQKSNTKQTELKVVPISALVDEYE